MEKYIDVINKFFDFLMHLLDSVLKGKVADYKTDIQNIIGAAEEAVTNKD